MYHRTLFEKLFLVSGSHFSKKGIQFANNQGYYYEKFGIKNFVGELIYKTVNNNWHSRIILKHPFLECYSYIQEITISKNDIIFSRSEINFFNHNYSYYFNKELKLSHKDKNLISCSCCGWKK